MDDDVAMIALTALLVGSFACRSDEASARVTVRDSAGIEIVESSTSAWTSATAWRVADTPSVVIGDERDSTARFGNVRTLTRLASGRIVIADGSADHLRYFSPDGVLERTVGRRGAGPAEFNFIAWIAALPGDSLLVLDANNHRFALFDSAGGLVRSTNVPGARFQFPAPKAILGDGTLLSSRLAGDAGPPRLGPRRFTTVWIRISRDLRIIDTLGTSPGGDGYLVACGQPGEGMGICNYSGLFERTGTFTAWRDRLFVGDGDRYEIAVIDTSGRTIQSIRRLQTPRPVTTDAIAAQRAERIGRYPNESRREAERVYAEIPVPETMPAYSRVVADAEGNLWVEEYRVTADEPLRWTVFDSAGRMLGTLAVPPTLRIMEIHRDVLIGVARDSLDVPQVRVYPIRKPD
jgi:hypothetical protein